MNALICLGSFTLALYVAGHTFRAARIERWRDQRWFSLTSLTAAVYIAMDSGYFLDVAPSTRFALDVVQLAAACAHVTCWMVFSERLLGTPLDRWDRAFLGGLAVAAGVSSVPGWVYRPDRVGVIELSWLHSTIYQPLPGPLTGAVYLAILLSLARVMRRFWRARRVNAEACWYFYGLVLLLLCGANDACVGAQLYAGPILLPAGFVLPIVVSAVVQTDRLVSTARDLDLLSAHLEREVQERSLALLEARQTLDRTERLAAIGQLAAGVAHEVNNPAAAIQSNLAYLRDELASGRVPYDAAECIDESLGAVQRVATIVRQLRDSGRAAANPGACEPVLVAGAVKAALSGAGPQLARAEVEQAIPPGLHLRGNEGYLVQVLTNLVVNAVQAARAGEAPRIAVRAESRGDEVVVEVSDRGTGMSAATLARIWEPFFTTKPVGQGTGLGLSVSRGLVQTMGGRLEAESELGRGTTMRITLPLAQSAARPGSRPFPAVGVRRRVVLIDDDPDVRRALSRELGQIFEVVAADGVQEGLARTLAGPPPDLVLCDVVMADGGGARLYQLLEASNPELARKVVFVTGGAITPEDRDFLAAQPQPVLFKPVQKKRLLELLGGDLAGSAA